MSTRQAIWASMAVAALAVYAFAFGYYCGYMAGAVDRLHHDIALFEGGGTS